MNRRNFLHATVLGATAGIARGGAPLPASRAAIEVVCFDGLAIFDPRPIGAVAEAIFPGRGAELTAAWRTRQFEYTWLRTLTGSYADFWQVTQDALAFACATLRLDLPASGRDRLMQAWLQLKPWPDVASALQRLRAGGARLAFLTNFSRRMLDANVEGAALGGFFEARLSTDAVGAYKPDPRSYRMAAERFSLPLSAMAFVAFAGWDAAGASHSGFRVYWSNRLGQPAEELGAAADRVDGGLDSLPAFVAGH